MGHGQSTWLLRQAVDPETKIYSLDPEPVKNLFWLDRAAPGDYYVGPSFKDFTEIDWDTLIPQEDREHTLVMLDDHMSSIRRSKELLAKGFVHIWYDDNYSGHHTKGDCYSFNQICTSLSKNTNAVEYKDN